MGPIAILAVLTTTQMSLAEAVQDIATSLAAPLAVRGGVLMLPLFAREAGDQWPTTMTLVLADGRELTGPLGWMEGAPAPAQRRWTDDPRYLRVRAIEPGDDTSLRGSGTPYLLVRLPYDASGRIRFGGQTLAPRWRDKRRFEDRLGQPAHQRRLELAASPAYPDPTSPLEYWRWVLLASRSGYDPPAAAAYGEIGALVAEHYNDLWQLGLSRLATTNPGIAAQCRDLLTQTCQDGDKEFAAWVVDPASLTELLNVMLNFNREDRVIAERALIWADERDLLIIWPQTAALDQITLAVANPSFEAAVLRFEWPDVADSIPLAVEIEPRVLTRVHLDRPPPPERAPLAVADSEPDDSQKLVIHHDGRQRIVRFGQRSVVVQPPGVIVGPLRAPLTLMEARAHQQRIVAADQTTFVQIRKMHERWEIFFECRRTAQSIPGETRDLGLAASFWDSTQTEAFTLCLGSPSNSDAFEVVLTIAEAGAWRLFAGSNDGTLEVHRRSYADRWYGRVVVPTSWLGGDPELGALPTIRAFAFVRTHGDSAAIESGPDARVPWRRRTGGVALDLRAWGGIPDEPIDPRAGFQRFPTGAGDRVRGGGAPLSDPPF